ncbi:hypothetical protein M2263_003525 [Providencia alcalifaciens]|nr:hypothetical protein [Providencia alcalifaciens]
MTQITDIEIFFEAAHDDAVRKKTTKILRVFHFYISFHR